MKFKNYTQGNLTLINANAKVKNPSGSTSYLFEDSYYKSEEFAIMYYNSKGYNAFFSENDPWRRLLKILFKDIFKKFKAISKKKGYKYGFYNNEFYIICEDEIWDRINYLKNIDLLDEVKKNYINAKIRDKVLKICEKLDDEQILSILHYMLQDYNNRKRGFPDLFVFNDDEFFFSEVKAKTDYLSAYQVRNHEKLLNTGIDVCLFTINKSQSDVDNEKWKYFNEDFYDVDNFKEKYDFKVKIANRVHDELIDNGIENLKAEFISRHDSYAYMGFLNLIKDYSFDNKIKILENIDDILIDQSLKEGAKIKNLHFLSKGLYFEERGFYSKAIMEYKNAEDFYGYQRLCTCYRKTKDYEKEVELTYDVINNVTFSSSDCKLYFKSRAQRFTRYKKKINVYKTNNKCPFCGSNEMVVVLKRRDNIKIRICDNGSCYWYGGLYDSDVNQLEQVTDLKYFNVDFDLNDSISKFGIKRKRRKQQILLGKVETDKGIEKAAETDVNYAKNLEIKYELIKKGESLLNNGDYEESVEFYKDLLNHEFFINDYYPFVMLVKSYKGLKQHDKEVEVITQFYKSGRYCKKSVLKKFRYRLGKLDELGYYDYRKVDGLEEEFKNNGAKNRKLRRVPLPQAREIKSNRKKLNQKPLKYSPDSFDSYVEYDENMSYDNKIKFKYQLILKGEELYKKREYGKAIAYYTRLLNHDLFVNDYYPHAELVKALHKTKRFVLEVEVIEKFFKSGVFCNENKLNWFTGKLRKLARMGIYDFSKFVYLKQEYEKNGALNNKLSHKPVPTADSIIKMYK